MINLWSVQNNYQDQNGTYPVIQKLNAKFYRGELIIVQGPAGSGKTTLANIIAGLDKPNLGLVQVDGLTINEMTKWERAIWRSQNIGFIHQFSTMNKEKNLFENLSLSTEPSLTPLHTRQQNLSELVKTVRLEEQTERPLWQLSHDQQKLAELTNALAHNPKIIILDNFMSGIKTEKTLTLVMNMVDTQLNRGKTVIIFTDKELPITNTKTTTFHADHNCHFYLM